MRKLTRLHYDLVEKHSLKFFPKEYNEKTTELNKENKARIGFYYLVFNILFGYMSNEEVTSCIIDSEFCRSILGIDNKDHGIDAVYIDENEKKINLFSFKYRDSLKKGTEKKQVELYATIPFIGLLDDEVFEKQKDSISEDSSRTIVKINAIKEALTDDYTVVLYMVSNDRTTTETNSVYLEPFQSQYSWIELKTFNLYDIMDAIEIKKKDNKAELRFPINSILEHNVSFSGKKNYIAEVRLSDIVRITSNDEAIRERYDLDDLEEIRPLELDFDLLFDNVRDYLGNTKFNKQIVNTIKDDYINFFIYNNGLTITADNITTELKSQNRVVSVVLENFQVVNGGQTLRAIYTYKNMKNSDLNNLNDASILVRLLDTNSNHDLTSKISEYTNSQNPIKAMDLRSLDTIQLTIENRLQLEKIYYARKRGKILFDEEEYEFSISMEKVGQLLFAYKGFPEKAGNNKVKIFTDHYDSIFNDDPTLFDRIIKQIEIYREALLLYSDLEYEYYEQKVYYIIFIKKHMEDWSVKECIQKFEEWITTYEGNSEMSMSRRLLQRDFKNYLENKIEEYTITDSSDKTSQ